MRKVIMVLVIGLFLLSFAAPVFAENQGGTFTLDPFTGFNLFDGKKHMDNGQINGLRGGYNFTPNLGAETFFGYTASEARRVNDQRVDVYHYGIDVLYHFNPEGVVVPFVAAGLGILQSNGPSGPTTNNQTRGAVDFGFGVKYFVSDTVALRADAREVLFRDADNNRSNYDIMRSNRGNVEVMIGMTFLLGAEKKAVAAMPSTADTTAPEVVCTNPGSNVTGWAVDKNITATFSEDMDRSTITTSTFTVKNGTTPVKGKVTFAGTTATFDPAGELEKGTTYTATIAAGVKDRAGNVLANSYEWSFTTIPAVKIVPAVLISLEDSHFDFDSAALSENGKTILNYNAKILKESPSMKIRIAGYTSASGTKEYNQKLSERRATSVKNYLVKEGVAENRLTKIGYGETRPAEYEPVPSNIYSEAAKANMRVLFEVIAK
jgi:OOP family OmpA-OmpF porin